MPPHLTVADYRLKSIADYLPPALGLLDELGDAFGGSFVQLSSQVTLSLITAVQNVKRNRDECLELMENIHHVLLAIVDVHIKSEPAGSLHPAILDHIGTFTQTLQKIRTFVEAQQDGSRIKYFFRQSEMNRLLKDCRYGLDQALEAFKIDIGANVFNSIDEMKQKTENMHNELLEIIATLSDGTFSDRSSSVYQKANESYNSSNSFSMLPSEPKIFYGRESELRHLVETLSQDSPRVAILGGGGMGKTSLARAALHHPDIPNKFEHRYFVSAESATNSLELAALIGLHLGLNPGKDLTKAVVQYFSNDISCLLILDNLETPWEPIPSRGGVEEFLSLLTDIPHLALMITMRGAERPAKVAWTHPFLLPLQPLSDDAAQKTFIDITEGSPDEEDMKQLLRFTDNMPLAVDLIAHLADYEGCANVLARWETEKTSILSAGNDRKSNLDTSIALSLSSSRITSGAKELLSLLSILPDGLSDIELLQSKLPIKDIRSCKTALVATSLAYIDIKKRLRMLTPTREHVQRFSPPPQSLTHPLRKHFHSLLILFKKYRGTQLEGIINQITLNLGNLQQLLILALHAHDPDPTDIIQCIINLHTFLRTTGRGSTPLITHIPEVLSQHTDHELDIHFIVEVLLSDNIHPISDPELLISQGISHCNHFDDPVLKCKFYTAAGYYQFFSKGNTYTALELLEKGLTLSRSCGEIDTQCLILTTIADIRWGMGEYATAQARANEARRLANLTVNLYQEALALCTLAQCAGQLGNYRNSIIHFHRAKEIQAICGMLGGRTDIHIEGGRAEIHLLKSEYMDARSIFTQILQDSDQDLLVSAHALVDIARIDVIIGAAEQHVQKNLNEATRIFSTLDHFRGGVLCNMVLADLKLRERDIISAKPLFENVLHLTRGRQNEVISFALERLADRSRWKLKEYTATWPTVYLGHAQQSKRKLDLHKALFFLGDVFISQGDDDTGYSLFTVALEGFVCMDVHHSRAQCLFRLGDLANKKGDFSQAVELWTAARPFFERSSQAKDTAKIDGRLAELENKQMALVHLAKLHFPETVFEELSSEVEKFCD